MGIDWIPGVSQVKSIVQVVTGDVEGAARTAENFARECPGVSQVVSVAQFVVGDVEGAKETQKRCFRNASQVANGVPVIGHAKGLVHHALGDHKGGNQAFNAATRSTVVVASGAAAAVATGGLGAIPAGIAAGVGYDATATVVTGEEQGYVAAIKNVAENPSAGSIIDAVAIPVGDGLAGYSGGQMATKIQLSHLESVRAAKLEAMESATTSGARLKFSNEAMAANAKINTIKHGTPHVFNDPKTGTVVGEASAPPTAVPVPSYINESKKDQKVKILNANVLSFLEQQCATAAGCIAAAAATIGDEHYFAQESAIYNDSYVESMTITANNKQQAQKRMHERDEQEPEGDILDSFKGTKFTTAESLLDLLNSMRGDDPNRNPDRPPWKNMYECLRELLSWAWLLLIMPVEFPFTLAARVNCVADGFYHSFVRHVYEWQQVIPRDYNRLIEDLDPLIVQIKDLSSANNIYDVSKARERFDQAKKNLDREKSNRVGTALLEIQVEMYRFIQQNLTFENYLGRSENTNFQERLYFKVSTPTGRMVMVLGVLTKKQFLPRPSENRPTRMLITVYFETWTDFLLHGLLEKKEEMQKRRKK